MESRYRLLFSQLNSKLDDLVYLKKLNSLNHESEDEVNKQFEEIKEALPVLKSSDLAQISEFLSLQTKIVKTNSLNLEYLQLVLPVLRAIHLGDSTSISGKLISENLDLLYSPDSPDGIKQLIAAFKSSNVKDLNSIKLQSKIKELISNQIQPKLRQLKQLNKLNSERSQLLESLRRQQMSVTRSSSTAGDIIKSQFKEIQNTWSRISLYSEFLPGLIMSTSSQSNWADNEKFVDIITESGDIGVLLNDQNHIINLNIDISSIEEILLKST